MGAMNSAICVVAAGLLYGTGHPILLFIAIVNAIIEIASWQHMRYSARMLARDRLIVEKLQSGDLGTADVNSREAHEYWERLGKTITMSDASRRDFEDVPNWITTVNMFGLVIGIVLLVSGIVFRVL